MSVDEDEDEILGVEEGTSDDVALQPGRNADSAADIHKYIDNELLSKYEVYSYRHAAAILANSYRDSLAEITDALLRFSITTREIGTPGGNESEMPKKFSRILRPKWLETRIQGDLLVREQQVREYCATPDGKPKKEKLPPGNPITVENYIDGHKIDYVSGRVAFDFEWNSKDQTFDRDLYALRMFHECGLISVGVIVTRGQRLSPLFDRIPKRKKDGSIVMKGNNIVPCTSKYGASTTWMGKLLYRLNAGRHGGCPVLAFGITPAVISDQNKIPNAISEWNE